MSSWKFYFETYGCKVNQHESQLYREAWQELGGIECQNPAEANYICINSCAITARAERDARNAIYRLRRLAPQAKIILTGCAAQFLASLPKFKNECSAKVDFFLPQSAKGDLAAGPQALFAANGSSAPIKLPFPTHFTRARAIVKVQDGCRQNCTYCIVPQTRSALQSVAPDKVLNECRQLAENGHGELMLSGINLRHYGKDNGNYGDFWDLLAFLDKELAQDYAAKLRLRISSIEPSQLTEKALQVLSESRLLCPHLHLSLQHASPKLLKEMGRGHYKAEQVLDFTKQLRKIWPIFALGADLLIGFPGESEEDLKFLQDFITAAPFSYAHVFPYSQRQGTIAGARMDQLPQRLRRERASSIRAQIKDKKADFLQKLCALREMTIAPEIVREKNSGLVRGVNEYYVPCYLKIPQELSGLTKVKPLLLLEEAILVENLR